MNKKLEICCYSADAAITAERWGADRIELCDNYSEGGTTPSYAMAEYIITRLEIPVNVIVRPRGGDFLYSDEEYEIIKRDIEVSKNLNANGIVTGFLTPDGDIDMARTAEIVELAAPMEVTFHRAVDLCRDTVAAVGQLKSAGVRRILSSGGRGGAHEGREVLREMIGIAGDDIIIMPGGGINDKNIAEIINYTGAREFHSSAKTFIGSRMRYFREDVKMGGADKNEYDKITVDGGMVTIMKNILMEG